MTILNPRLQLASNPIRQLNIMSTSQPILFKSKPFISLKWLTLMAFALAAPAFAQLQWISDDPSDNLVTANVASGGDQTSGSPVTFTIPAGTQLFFVTKNFTPFSLAGANSAKVVSFQMSASGGLTGATSGQRVIGFGCYNSASTASFTDDVGYFGMFNAANYTEPYYHSAGAANLFSGTKPGQGTTTTGFPVNNTIYTNQLFMKINSTVTGISLGTGGSSLAAARSEERRVGKEGRSRWSRYH